MADKGKEDKKESAPKPRPEPERETVEYTPVHTPPPSTVVPEQTILRTGDNPEAGARRPEASICILDIDDSEIDMEERPSDTDSIRQLRLRRKQFEELRRDHYQRMYYDDGSIISGSAIRGSTHVSEDESGSGKAEEANADAEKKEEQQKPEEKDKDKDKEKN
ncbi:GL19536 [Drosophila persimilis]|uniref:GL19536 n=1 Tax=Drosophila persimilis TaxID=7234 RepID=B4G9S5_DROPE|nr:GL19536 [Drosophila persimilis]